MAPRFAVDLHHDSTGYVQQPINFTGSGDNTVIAGVSGQIIRIWWFWFKATAATVITWKDGASNALSGPVNFGADDGIVLDFNTKPWYTMSAGNSFVLNSTNAVQVSGTVYFTQENA